MLLTNLYYFIYIYYLDNNVISGSIGLANNGIYINEKHIPVINPPLYKYIIIHVLLLNLMEIIMVQNITLQLLLIKIIMI